MKRFITLMCALGVLAAVPPAEAATGTGSLAVTRHFDPSEGVPTEGFKEYLRVLHDGKLVERLELTKDRTSLTLAPGRYRLVRYVRDCDGVCSNLDAPSSKCRADAVVKGGKRTAVTINSFAARCRITVAAPRG